MVLSPFAQPANSLTPLPDETIHLVDPRLQMVYEEPHLSEELGLAPAPSNQISLIAQVRNLDQNHHFFVEDLGGEKYSTKEDVQQFLDSQNAPVGEKIEIPINTDEDSDENKN